MTMKRMFRCSIVPALLVVGLGLNAEIGVKMAVLDEGKVQVTFTNTSDSPIAFLRYQTPLDGVDNNLFQVEREGQEIPYVGRLALRLGPVEEDWQTLNGKSSVSVAVDLGENYVMDRSGQYTVKFSSPMAFRHADGTYSNLDGIEKEVTSEPVDIQLSKALYVAPLMVTGNHTMSGCNGEQKATLTKSMQSGQELSKKGHQSINGDKVDAKYELWWGTFSSSNSQRIKSNFKKIDQSFDSNWKLTCTTDSNCKKGVIAYVYPNQAFSVFICNYFHDKKWTNYYTGSFLLHEASHWQAVASTQDHGYGISFCQNLAKTDPNKAVSNADTYRFYALDLAGEVKQ